MFKISFREFVYLNKRIFLIFVFACVSLLWHRLVTHFFNILGSHLLIFQYKPVCVSQQLRFFFFHNSQLCLANLTPLLVVSCLSHWHFHTFCHISHNFLLLVCYPLTSKVEFLVGYQSAAFPHLLNSAK